MMAIRARTSAIVPLRAHLCRGSGSWVTSARCRAALLRWASMTPPILLCTDGSEQSLDALSLGLDLLGRTKDLVLVTVATAPDPASLVGSGHAGPDMNPQQYDREVTQATEGADAVIRRAQ